MEKHTKERESSNGINQSYIYPRIKEYPVISHLQCEKHQLTATLSDGRIVSVPTAWFSRLRKATSEQLKNFELLPDGYGITWPQLDEDISIKAFINGL